MSHREALEKILRICYESSDYNRRTQHIHEAAMLALGMTENQRTERHIKASMRSEAYKASIRTEGRSKAKKQLVREIEEESGEPRTKFSSILERIVA